MKRSSGRARRAPQIELRVELAADAFDVHQGLLQQQQLRQDFHMEALRRLEQPQQQVTDGDILHGAIEDRFADGAYGEFEFVDPGFRREPSRTRHGARHAAVIAPEESGEILGQVALIEFAQRTHDAEIDRREARGCHRIARHHEKIAGMHVGVKEMIAKNLGEEDLDARARPIA
jgi:hypothetical protein